MPTIIVATELYIGTRIWLKRRYRRIPPRATVEITVEGLVVVRRCESDGGGGIGGGRLGMAWR